ncbi:MAG: DUF4398 domain-containing protein [Rubrivivax sp.]|nr:DUF4398 domain-containing protein [Rubrivivax sp.]MDP3224091.1 DUF4398 domain-containing protein [Rubrivivax sp.]MDP3611196.1 DUF4398 domain-containing protein [Rubrivivax sp.]
MTPQSPTTLVHRLAQLATASNAVRSLSAVAVLAITVGVAACASVPPPSEQIAVTTAAVANAAAVGAQELAPAELGLARDKLRRANLAMASQDHLQADRLAQQAQLDAQVAAAKANSAKARKAAEEVQAASRALREEMNRKAP